MSIKLHINELRIDRELLGETTTRELEHQVIESVRQVLQKGLALPVAGASNPETLRTETTSRPGKQSRLGADIGRALGQVLVK